MPSMKSILIVEDEHLVGWSLTRALEKNGYCVSVADTTERAQECLSSARFDLVITDVRLPSRSGYDLVSSLDPDIPVIVISSSLPPAAECSGLRNHFYLEKPFHLNDITDLVGSILQEEAG